MTTTKTTTKTIKLYNGNTLRVRGAHLTRSQVKKVKRFCPTVGGEYHLNEKMRALLDYPAVGVGEVYEAGTR
jgi:hypothetical protein